MSDGIYPAPVVFYAIAAVGLVATLLWLASVTVRRKPHPARPKEPTP